MTDITRKRGDTYPHNIKVMSATTKAALDVTGFSFLLTVDPSPVPTSSDNNLLQITGVIEDAAGGLVSFTPTSLQADQTAGRYYYDIQMTYDTGEILTIDNGAYIVEQDITK
jgi:hypothetical protein